MSNENDIYNNFVVQNPLTVEQAIDNVRSIRLYDVHFSKHLQSLRAKYSRNMLNKLYTECDNNEQFLLSLNRLKDEIEQSTYWCKKTYDEWIEVTTTKLQILNLVITKQTYPTSGKIIDKEIHRPNGTKTVSPSSHASYIQYDGPYDKISIQLTNQQKRWIEYIGRMLERNNLCSRVVIHCTVQNYTRYVMAYFLNNQILYEGGGDHIMYIGNIYHNKTIDFIRLKVIIQDEYLHHFGGVKPVYDDSNGKLSDKKKFGGWLKRNGFPGSIKDYTVDNSGYLHTKKPIHFLTLSSKLLFVNGKMPVQFSKEIFEHTRKIFIYDKEVVPYINSFINDQITVVMIDNFEIDFILKNLPLSTSIIFASEPIGNISLLLNMKALTYIEKSIPSRIPTDVINIINKYLKIPVNRHLNITKCVHELLEHDYDNFI